MSAIHDLLLHLENAMGSLAQEVEKEASVITQWAAGDWAKLKDLVTGAHAEAFPIQVESAAVESPAEAEPTTKEAEDAGSHEKSTA